MTRNYDNTPCGSNNPLYNKLRQKFSYNGRTIADVVVMRAIRDGYNPRATKEADCKPERRNTAEISIKRANSIMEEERTTVFNSPDARETRTTTEAATVIIGGAPSASATYKKSTKSQKNTRSRRPLNIGFAAVLVLCFGLLMYLVFTGMQINELNRELSTLRDSNALLEADRTYYNEQLANKNDMDLILKIATDELGMVKESEVSHVVLGEGNGDTVEVYEPEEKDTTFISNLLNAFTESFGK